MMTEQENKCFQEGRRLFNAGYYFEAHEEWEQIWLHRLNDDRLFFQGLILLTGSFCHFKKKKWQAAQKAMHKALIKLDTYGPVYCGVSIQMIQNLVSQNLKLIDLNQFESLIWPHQQMPFQL